MKLFNLGFNHGYFIKKYFSSFYNTLLSGIQSENEYINGFDKGGIELSKEIEKDKLSDIQKIRFKSADKEKDLEK